MKMTAKFVLGKVAYEVTIDGKMDKESLHKLIVLSNPRQICSSCKSEGYDKKYFTSNKDKEGNVYINVKCGNCGGRSKLGYYKSGGFFWHDYEVYQKPGEDKKQDEKAEEPPITDYNDEDIPF